MQFSRIVDHVLALARQASEEPTYAARGRIKKDLKAFLVPLSPAEIYMLITLMYLGRDGGGVAGLIDNYQQMSDTFTTPKRAIDQMLEKSRLHDYLRSGVDTLEAAGIDIDTLVTTHIDSPLALLNSGEGVELTLGPWNCDTCGQVIIQPNQGMLQWFKRKDNGRHLGRDLRIVHHIAASPLSESTGCYPDEGQERAKDGSTLYDEHLDQMLGPDGLVRLLLLVEDGLFPTSDVSRVIMRLFVPGYERARPYFQKAVSTGLVDPGLVDDYFLQTQLQEIVANIPRLER